MTSIQDLKRNYRLATARGQALAITDLGTAFPLSTGNELYDAALTGTLKATATMSSAEQLARAWQLCQKATDDELVILADESAVISNDFRMLGALQAWQRGHDQLTRRFLAALPWHWRLAFPTAVLSPARHFFSGWRRDLRFRLVDEPRHEALRTVFAELLADAPPVVIIKYRRTIKESAALQRYRFDGDRPTVIHQVCFGSLNDVDRTAAERVGLATVGAVADLVNASDSVALADVLDGCPDPIPLTSIQGVLAARSWSLADDRLPAVDRIRRYVLLNATAVELIGHLKAWGPWLDDANCEILARRYGEQVERGLSIPFFRVLTAFQAADDKVRERLARPLLLPTMRAFGRDTAGLLDGGPTTFVLTSPALGAGSLLLYACLAAVAPTRLVLAGAGPGQETSPPSIEAILDHIAKPRLQFEQWLLQAFGLGALARGLRYDMDQLCRFLATDFDTEAPLVVDFPFAHGAQLLDTLAPFRQVFNLSGEVGAPNEICVSARYQLAALFVTYGVRRSAWFRDSSQGAVAFAQFLQRLDGFKRLTAAAQRHAGETQKGRAS